MGSEFDFLEGTENLQCKWMAIVDDPKRIKNLQFKWMAIVNVLEGKVF